MDILPLELSEMVFNFLSPLDQIKISLTCKKFRNILLYHRKKHHNMSIYLQKYVNNPVNFRNCLIDNSVKISGSVILECILGKKSNNYNLDIYCKNHDFMINMLTYLVEYEGYQVDTENIKLYKFYIKITKNNKNIYLFNRSPTPSEKNFYASHITNFWNPQSNFIYCTNIKRVMDDNNALSKKKKLKTKYQKLHYKAFVV
jgi:hypothetical protein